MKKYKAVITDFDMTIADTGDLIEECLYQNALRFGFDFDRKILRAGIGLTAEALYRKAGANEEEAKMLHREYIPYSAEAMIEKTTFFPSVKEGLRALSENGIPVSILSLKASNQIMTPLKKAGIGGFITSVIGPGEVSAHKPKPDGIYYISEKLGVALCDILYVGDSVTDMKTALNAGVDFAAITAGAVSAEEFAEMGAKMIYPSFGEMCRDLISSTVFAQI